MDYEPLEKLEIQLLLEGIYKHYGLDFRNYSLPSIQRRIWNRIRLEGLQTISGLQEKVLHNEELMKKLFTDFSINVTEMFRDPEFFLAFKNKVLPELRKFPAIRIWHAGCSSGEEVYSMAILLKEEGLYKKTLIYATDMNEEVLQKASEGTFPLNKMKEYTKNYLRAGGKKAFSEYYSVQNERAVFEPELTKNVVFAHHNLATDASFNEFHMIICRNVLIYFNEVLQERVSKLFYESLATSGFLGLGSKETIDFTSNAEFFETVDKAQKIYAKVK